MTDTLLLRTAKAMYRKDPWIRNHVDFGSLLPAEQVRYERMASAALTVLLGEDVEPDLLTTR